MELLQSERFPCCRGFWAFCFPPVRSARHLTPRLLYKARESARVRACAQVCDLCGVAMCWSLGGLALFLNSLSPGVLKLPDGKFFLGKSCTSYFSFLSRFYFWLCFANLLPASGWVENYLMIFFFLDTFLFGGKMICGEKKKKKKEIRYNFHRI